MLIGSSEPPDKRTTENYDNCNWGVVSARPRESLAEWNSSRDRWKHEVNRDDDYFDNCNRTHPLPMLAQIPFALHKLISHAPAQEDRNCKSSEEANDRDRCDREECDRRGSSLRRIESWKGEDDCSTAEANCCIRWIAVLI